MISFFNYLFIQLKMDLRSRGTLMNYYLTPLLFYVVMGSVFAHTNPTSKLTLPATLIIFAIVMGTTLGMPTPIVSMREGGVLRAFRVNGISNGTVMFTHAVSAFLHIFIVSLVIYFTAPYLFNSQYPANPAMFFLLLLVFLLASIFVGMLIGAFAPNQSYCSMLSLLIFFPSILLSGIMVPASQLPNMLVWIGRMLPATYGMQLFKGLVYGQQVDISAMASITVIAVIALIALALTFIKVNAISKSEF